MARYASNLGLMWIVDGDEAVPEVCGEEKGS